ncbi:Histone chaperone asf1 [Saitoella coloradoensis]
MIVNILNIQVLNNPAKFSAPYEFEITFECLEPLKNDLEWKLTYVGSATSDAHDQVLDSLLVGPIPVGVNKFVFTADPPDTTKIPAADAIGCTVILLTCSYDDREFVRVGYYVNNEYDVEEWKDPESGKRPDKVQWDHVLREILADKPRVTRFNIKWDSGDDLFDYPPEQPGADEVEADEETYGADEAAAEEAEEGEEEEVEEEEEEEEAGADGEEGAPVAEPEVEGEEDLEEDDDEGSVDLDAEGNDDVQEVAAEDTEMTDSTPADGEGSKEM